MSLVKPKMKRVEISQDELAVFLRTQLDSEIAFSGHTKSCCIGIVDMVNSTVTTAKLTNGHMCKYYSIFLSAMSKIIRQYEGKIIKNLGDSLLYYFPRTVDGQDADAFGDVLECGLSMLSHHGTVNKIMSEFKLPPISYRVSADYGTVSIAHSSFGREDIFGPTVNLCSKMNGAAKPDTFVIGGDLHQITKAFGGYQSSLMGGYGSGLKFDYPVYTVQRRSGKWL